MIEVLNQRYADGTTAHPRRRAIGFRWALLLAMVTALWGGVPALRAVSLTAALDRQTVPVGESVTLTLTFEGGRPRSTPGLPAIPGLQLASVNQSSRVNMVNGQVTSLVMFEYVLVATQPGEVAIPALRVPVDNQVLASQSLSLRVVPAGTPPPGQPEGPPEAFVRLVVPKTEVYLGESFPVEIHLFWRNGQEIRTPQLQADGFSVNQGREPNYTQSQTRVGNVAYNLIVFRMIATPVRDGDLTLGPASVSMTILTPVQRPRRRDPFFDADPFDFFGARMQSRPATLTSDPQPIQVSPLPSVNVPESFNGAVGQFAMTVTASPTNVAVGDPITVRARVTGRGLLESLNLPEQPQWREFKLYPPSATVETQDPLGLSGSKTFEQVVIPQNHEVSLLPSLVFSYFDPAARSYRTLSNAPVALSVALAGRTATPFPALTNQVVDADERADDIVHIRPSLDAMIGWRAPWVQQPWFLALQSIPPALWLGFWAVRRRREALLRDPRRLRQLEVSRRVQQGLRDLRTLAAGRQSDDFFATLFRLLQEQLGERLDQPASAITEAVIDGRLRESALDPSVLDALHELFQTCNQVRYAPVVSQQEMAGLLPKVELVFKALQLHRP